MGNLTPEDRVENERLFKIWLARPEVAEAMRKVREFIIANDLRFDADGLNAMFAFDYGPPLPDPGMKCY